MIRTLLRIVLVLLVVVAIAAFFLGYRWRTGQAEPNRPVATSGHEPVDTDRAREAAADIGEKVAVGANRADEALTEVGITAKIKSKLALDDTMEHTHISVHTDDDIVTLDGTVTSSAQRTRAVQLARETEGVVSVVDRVRIE